MRHIVVKLEPRDNGGEQEEEEDSDESAALFDTFIKREREAEARVAPFPATSKVKQEPLDRVEMTMDGDGDGDGDEDEEWESGSEEEASSTGGKSAGETPLVAVKREGGSGLENVKKEAERTRKKTPREFRLDEVREPSELIEQYQQTEAYSETNRVNTQAIVAKLKALENYTHLVFGEGKCTMTFVQHYTELAELLHQCCAVIDAQQRNMADLVANSVIYYSELYDRHNELQRMGAAGQPRRKNPASPFNTVQAQVDTIPLSNENRTVKSRASSTQTIASIF